MINSETETLSQQYTTCPSTHPNSAQGSWTINQCYRSCATTDVDNSASVSGKYYYDNSNNCAATSCAAGYYQNGTTCTACPSGYPNSDAGATAITQCYSNTKSRAWTGSQVDPTMPDSWYSRSLTACSVNACDYVAYANAAGTGDGTIKSGCSSNSSNCTKTQTATACKSNYYLSSSSCPACSGLGGGLYSSSANNNSTGSSACYASVTANQSLNAASDTPFTPYPTRYSHAPHT